MVAQACHSLGCDRNNGGHVQLRPTLGTCTRNHPRCAERRRSLPRTAGSPWHSGRSKFRSSAARAAGPVPAILKLHGSTNWGYNPTANDAPLVVTAESVLWQPADSGQPVLPRNIGLYDDLLPMIVPPMSSKAGYYSGPSFEASGVGPRLNCKERRQSPSSDARSRRLTSHRDSSFRNFQPQHRSQSLTTTVRCRRAFRRSSLDEGLLRPIREKMPSVDIQRI